MKITIYFYDCLTEDIHIHEFHEVGEERYAKDLCARYIADGFVIDRPDRTLLIIPPGQILQIQISKEDK